MAVFQWDFIKTGGGPDLALGLYFANPWGRPCPLNIIWRANMTFEVSIYFKMNFFSMFLNVDSLLRGHWKIWRWLHLYFNKNNLTVCLKTHFWIDFIFYILKKNRQKKGKLVRHLDNIFIQTIKQQVLVGLR